MKVEAFLYAVVRKRDLEVYFLSTEANKLLQYLLILKQEHKKYRQKL